MIWAKQQITRVEYRHHFGLSYQQFMSEPFDEFVNNKMILSIKNQIQEQELKKTSKKARIK